MARLIYFQPSTQDQKFVVLRQLHKRGQGRQRHPRILLTLALAAALVTLTAPASWAG
jgi:hypothetical protein